MYKIVSIWRQNKRGYSPADIICSGKRTVFQEEENCELNFRNEHAKWRLLRLLSLI